MIGQALSHYRIVEKIGAGGMGEVYKAHDERLDRHVAIKVLPSGTLADEHARKRFRKEALALSKLNHPNIATVHDFDTQDDVDFIVMEYVEGGSLADRVKTGPLPEMEISDLGVQIADALEEAHERGIVHRDLKPGNIAVTPKGRVKVLDFGLAKMLRPVSEEATTAAMTEELAVGGTLPYMSPEELRGERADHRTDLYSFGVVLYEMATGRRPFEEKQSTALTAAIVQKPPEPPWTYNRRISPGLVNIIIKALDKDPEHRYQTARDMRVDLERLTAPVSVTAPLRKRSRAVSWPRATVGVAAVLAILFALNVGGLWDRLIGEPDFPPIESLAVLPLENLSGDPEQEYFADGMTEALISDLAKIGALKVISRTSAMRYKDSDRRLPEIAAELNVDGIVEGTVLRAGDRIRITAQLIDASTDRHVWSESYEREMQNVLTLQSDVAQAIAREIRITLTPDEKTLLANASSVNPKAYEAYLKGRYHWNRRSSESLWRGLEYFEEATQVDPGYAPAYAGIADAYTLLADYRVRPYSEVIPLAKAAAIKALELDDQLADAHVSLAIILAFQWDWVGSEREYLRAIDLSPDHRQARLWYAGNLLSVGRLDESLAEVERARRLDPLAPEIVLTVGCVLDFKGQYDDAIEQYRQAIELQPDLEIAYYWLSHANLQKGVFEEAISAAKKAVDLSGRNPMYLGRLGHALAVSGKGDEALEVLEELNLPENAELAPTYEIALIFTHLGDHDRAFEWLEKALEERPFQLLFLKCDPAFDPLRADPRFQDLLRRMNFPE
jgi:serine/threonine-protein kinase